MSKACVDDIALGRFARVSHFKPCAGTDSGLLKHRFWRDAEKAPRPDLPPAHIAPATIAGMRQELPRKSAKDSTFHKRAARKTRAKAGKNWVTPIQRKVNKCEG